MRKTLSTIVMLSITFLCGTAYVYALDTSSVPTTTTTTPPASANPTTSTASTPTATSVSPAISTASTPTATSVSPAISAASTPLQGTVQRTAKTALVGLKSIGEVLHKLKRASAELYAECTRTDVQIIDEPDIIGCTVINIPISYSTGIPLPPRKKWVDFYTSELGQLIPILEEEIDSLLIPDNKQTASQSYLTDMVDCSRSINNNYSQLTLLSQSQPYAQSAMAAESKGINETIKQLEKDQKEIYHIVR